MGSLGALRGMARGTKVTTFYKTGTFSAVFAAIFGSLEDYFPGRRDGHFDARDGHYDPNDHRERKNDGFRAVRKLPFSPPPSPRRAYRQMAGGQKALAGRPNAQNVYLYILGKIFTIPTRATSVSHCGQDISVSMREDASHARPKLPSASQGRQGRRRFGNKNK